MPRPSVLISALTVALALLVGASLASAGTPPNRNDPCSVAGRDTCGTTGVGFYAKYRYGIRWFGDYRKVVPGQRNVFCIDLRYWYPGQGYRYTELDPKNLRNREGEPVSVTKQRRMAYAMWAFGRTSSANRQAATMLYVHSLMGDAAPGEVDPSALSRAVQTQYRRIARDAKRYHGPYRIVTKLPKRLTVGARATGTVRVLSATGRPVPNVRIHVRARGAAGAPTQVDTGANGVARVRLTPTAATDDMRLTVTTAKLPATLPKLYIPTNRREARNAQRVAAPSSQTLTQVETAAVAKARPKITTKATPAELLAGEDSTDEVTVSGLPDGTRVNATVRIHGPFRTREEIQCDGEPAWSGTVPLKGSGTVKTPVAKLERPGWYTYRLIVPETADVVGLTTPCAVPEESFEVDVMPAVTTEVSAQQVTPGSAISDAVVVTGLAGERATVGASLYGPFPTREAITCEGTPLWSGSFTATGDGTYETQALMLEVPGYYTYVETIAAQGFVRESGHPCGLVPETTIVAGSPKVTTKVSDQSTRPGDSITDEVVVSGAGALSLPVEVELWGPYPTREAISCEGTPYWSGALTADGDGTYTTQPVELKEAGYYTYVESIAGGEANSATATECGEVAETTFAQAAPKVTTAVSRQVTRHGSRIHDRIRVSGLGETSVPVQVELFGPFATRDAISCTGTPYWTGRVTAKGDGEVRSPNVVLRQAGFYTYRERIAGSQAVKPTETACAIAAETSLSTPAITTGRGERTRLVQATDAGGATPTRIVVPRLGIDAAVSTSGIDTADSTLGVPANIRRTGWWRDGARPGSRAGAVLIAGHLDSAKAGAGAFFRLPQAKAGERIRVRTRSGRTHTYRVTSVRAYRKARLPTNVFSTRGPARLVLVTCGGPFQRSQGFYRDNIVVTAVPA